MLGDTLLTELTALLAQEGDRTSTARAIAETIRAAGAYRWTGIYDVDLTKGVVSNIAWSGSGAPAYPIFPITNGLTSRAITAKKTINVGDVANDPDYLTALATTRSEIIIPVLDATGHSVIGTIDVESEHPHAFDSATQAHLEQCANVLRTFWNR
jgi:GAF domain-containing protein